MLLSDKGIAKAIDTGQLTVSPLPDPIQFQPASLDLRLGNTVENITTGETDSYEDGDEITFNPGEFYLCHTKESVGIPDSLAGILTGRSSVARQGLIIHTTAGFIDPGFIGEITLEVFVLRNAPVTLTSGSRIGQLLLFELASQPSGGYGELPDSKYQNQSGPTKSRLNEDSDSA